MEVVAASRVSSRSLGSQPSGALLTLRGFQLQVEQIVASVLGPKGFALGGGQALQVHGLVDRESKDLDHYVATMDEDLFRRAEIDLVRALNAVGLNAEPVARDSWFRQIIITDPHTKDTISIDLGYDYRKHPPVVVQGVGPVLDIQDVVIGKVRALTDRQTERDYIDIDAILSSGRWTVHDLWTELHLIRPEWTIERFAATLRAAQEGDPDEYAALGMTREHVTEMSNRLCAFAGMLQTPRPTAGASPAIRDSLSSLSSATRCDLCGRPLRSPESIARGRGPGCAKKR
ncbi:MAG: nucleotidyl transferase AbiEii/AbiGii toxin family protein [Actinobacteria bacterium]|nr:nucleotidyl transferase AbiEii/AbiGii toxin family protein [Actinomycetota bacterium]